MLSDKIVHNVPDIRPIICPAEFKGKLKPNFEVVANRFYDPFDLIYIVLLLILFDAGKGVVTYPHIKQFLSSSEIGSFLDSRYFFIEPILQS